MDRRRSKRFAEGDIASLRRMMIEGLTGLRRIEIEHLLPFISKASSSDPRILKQENRFLSELVDSTLRPCSLLSQNDEMGGYWFIPFTDPTRSKPFFLTFLRVKLECPETIEDAHGFPELIIEVEEWPIFLNQHVIERLRQRVTGNDRSRLFRLIGDIALLYTPMISVAETLDHKQAGIALSENCLLMGTVERQSHDRELWIRTAIAPPFRDRDKESLHRTTHEWMTGEGGDSLDPDGDHWDNWAYLGLDDDCEGLTNRLNSTDYDWLKTPKENAKVFEQELIIEQERFIKEHSRIRNVIPFPIRQRHNR